MRNFLLILVVLVQSCISINLTYIFKKSGNSFEPSCIAEETTRYAGIGWIYPLPNHEDNLPNITEKFIPTIINDFNCKFTVNHKCNRIWLLKNWEIQSNHRQFELIFDERWADFPTIFTRPGQNFKNNKIEIPKPTFTIGISIRANNNIEILTCDGWNPDNYPCYHINMTKKQLYLNKLTNSNVTGNLVDNYQAYANILSDDEWRNFIINLNENGVFSLMDVNSNRTVLEYHDTTPLKPLYLFLKSSEPALWKVHQNQFLSTKFAQISRLGPTLSLTSKDLCVSLYISTCPYCEMSFFIIKNNTRRVLKEVGPAENYQWKHIKLKDQNILQDKLNIFVETRFVDNNNNESSKREGFWAIDSVRVCHENEVKVTFLKLNDHRTFNDSVADQIACQVVEHPRWRPKKLVYSQIKEFPLIKKSLNSTSIKLSWEQEDPNNQITYFIDYAANDVCVSAPFNMHRIKSNGFLMTKHNEIRINGLIPFTKYNITFFSILHEKEQKLFVTTQELSKPTADELPNRLQIQVTDTTASISWDRVNCSSIYGHLFYSINITDNILKKIVSSKIQTDNTIQINDLQPYTVHTLKIESGRSLDDLKNHRNTASMSIDFTTKPGEAAAVKDLEVYAIDKDSVSLRYDLPKKTNGIPVYLQITRCNPLLFKKCKTTILPITRCKFWFKKYCVEIRNLLPYQKHQFQISLKNDGTSRFGPKTQIEAYTMEQAPGPPSNITYKIVDCKESLDYCHLNLTWLHPYHQNSTITSFNIVLNSTDNATNTESIKEVLKITNESYTAIYQYQIKYIPYSTEYDLFIQSVNTKYKSEFIHKRIRTDDIGDHINQKPQLLGKSDQSLVFIVPPVDRRLKSYLLTIIIQDFNKNQTIPEHIKQHDQIYGNLCHNFGDTWQLPMIEITNSTNNITIGSGNGVDKYLKPSTNYCITFIVTNKYKNSEHYVVYYENVETEDVIQVPEAAGSPQYNHLYLLLLLLLLIPIAVVLYRWWKNKSGSKRRLRQSQQQQQQQNDNVYESLPFEECEDNCVNNDNYDHLLHK